MFLVANDAGQTGAHTRTHKQQQQQQQQQYDWLRSIERWRQ